MANNRPSMSGDGAEPESWLNSMISAGKDAAQNDNQFEVVDALPVMSTTTSSQPSRPRTLKAGYDFQNSKLIVVFRDGTWWEYRGVPEEMWTGFKSSTSKGSYLRSSGLDSWGDMGPADVDNMPAHRREQMNSLTEFAKYVYPSKSIFE